MSSARTGHNTLTSAVHTCLARRNTLAGAGHTCSAPVRIISSSAACVETDVEAFPFTEAEWTAVSDAALPIVNASFAEDRVLQASCLTGLLDVLAELRAKYGDHPMLLETEADFAEDDADRAALYQQALEMANAHGLPTLSICLSLAELLLDSEQPAAAHNHLLECEKELREADESERASWAKLVAKSKTRGRQTSG